MNSSQTEIMTISLTPYANNVLASEESLRALSTCRGARASEAEARKVLRYLSVFFVSE